MERNKDTILDLDIWRNPQRTTNKGTCFHFLGRPDNSNFVPHYTFFTALQAADPFLKICCWTFLWPPVQCTISQCMTASD
jgi:hypothetical protein